MPFVHKYMTAHCNNLETGISLISIEIKNEKQQIPHCRAHFQNQSENHSNRDKTITHTYI